MSALNPSPPFSTSCFILRFAAGFLISTLTLHFVGLGVAGFAKRQRAEFFIAFQLVAHFSPISYAAALTNASNSFVDFCDINFVSRVC